MKYSEIKEKDGVLYYDIYTKENIPELRIAEDYVNAKNNPDTGDFDELFERVYYGILPNSVREVFKDTKYKDEDEYIIENEWDDLYIKLPADISEEKKELYKKALKLAGDTIIDFYEEYIKNKGHTENCVSW